MPTTSQLETQLHMRPHEVLKSQKQLVHEVLDKQMDNRGDSAFYNALYEFKNDIVNIKSGDELDQKLIALDDRLKSIEKTEGISGQKFVAELRHDIIPVTLKDSQQQRLISETKKEIDGTRDEKLSPAEAGRARATAKTEAEQSIKKVLIVADLKKIEKDYIVNKDAKDQFREIINKKAPKQQERAKKIQASKSDTRNWKTKISDSISSGISRLRKR